MKKTYLKERTGRILRFAAGLIVCALSVFAAPSVFADNTDVEPAFDEVSLTLKVHKSATVEIPAVISGSTAYLSVSDLFTFLKIKNIVSDESNVISGTFLNESDPYLIDKTRNIIRYRDKEYLLTHNELIRSESGLFLATNLFQEIFGLECTFYFRSLSVDLDSKQELPLFREMRQEEMRKYIRKVKGEIHADTLIGRQRPMLYAGTADYAVYSTQATDGPATTRASLSVGGFLAGGETTLGLNYYTDQPVTGRNQYFRWRYVNNDNKALRQVVAGNISTPSIASIFSPVIGVQLTNTPTTYRKFYGSYTLNDRTEPGWIVELYVNNTLVDYAKADASGFFTFQVPLAYGNTEVKLRFYGPWGEEKSKVQNIVIPFTFLPKNELEYTVSAGMVEDSTNALFWRSSVNYGISNKISIGGGNEYLSTITTGRNIPYLNTSFSLTGNLLCNAEYDFGVRKKGLVSYRLPSNFIVELSYTKYDKDQKAIFYNYLEEKKGSISLPLRFRNFSIYSRLSVNHVSLKESMKLTLSEFIVSASYKKFSGNIHSYGYFFNTGTPVMYTDLSLGYRLTKGISITPTVRYNHTRNQVTGLKCIAEKQLWGRGYITMTYEQYTDYNIRNLQVGIRYVFSKAQAAVYANHHNGSVSFSEAVSGSLVFDPATSYVKAGNINKVGRGGITVLPFLDINCNGRRDKGEPRVSGLNVRVITGGRVEVSEKDSLIRIFDLEAYTNAYLEMDGAGLGSISWQLYKKTYSVPVEPNLMKLVEVPVTVVSEVSGLVKMKTSGQAIRRENIKINIYRDDKVLVTSCFPEDDGYYNYMGLTPGNYTIIPDTARLSGMQMSVVPASRKLSIPESREGEVFDTLDFIVESMKPAAGEVIPNPAEYTPTVAAAAPDTTTRRPGKTGPEQIIITDTSALNNTAKAAVTTKPETPAPAIEDLTRVASDPASAISGSEIDDLPGYYVVQAGAFKKQFNAKNVKKHIASQYNEKEVAIVSAQGYYKVLVAGYNSKAEAMAMRNSLRENGYPEAFIRKLSGGIAIRAFGDLNSNGIFDPGEPCVNGLTASLSTGGILEVSPADTLIRIFSFEADSGAILEVDFSANESHGWELRRKTFTVETDPVRMKLLEIPVYAPGMISGTVTAEGPAGANMPEMMRIQIYRADSTLLTTLDVPENGRFSFKGLKPGHYRIQPDTLQLQKLRLTSMPAGREIKLTEGRFGESVTGVDFALAPEVQSRVIPLQPNVYPELAVSDSALLIKPDRKNEIVNGCFAIQLGAFQEHSNARSVSKRVSFRYHLKVDIIQTAGYYKVLIPGYYSRLDATMMLNKLRKNGFPGAYLIYIPDRTGSEQP
ncbi:MAG TPA: SPOR domain-containing protein [Bacteroidales bacterium]|nr:SPOR domain-containing protein [Bacteroidales bacterium]